MINDEIIKVDISPDETELVTNFLDKDLLKFFTQEIGELNTTQLKSLKSFYIYKKNALIISSTGSGKTFGVLLPILNEIIQQCKLNNIKQLKKISVIYVCPLKALINDMFRNLSIYLDQIYKYTGIKITCGRRTGDNKQLSKNNFNILLITPENLFLFLTSKKNIIEISKLDYFIVDEMHAICGDKRGVQLSLSLVQILNINKLKGIYGVSATVSPIDKVGKFLFNNNDFCLIEGDEIKELEVICTLPKRYSYKDESLSKLEACKQLCKIINNEDTTLIFCNTRSLTESLLVDLMKLQPTLKLATHHSSLSLEERLEAENQLSLGKLNAILSASTLEQGIDVRTVTKVVLFFSPKRIDKATQRIGRAGHKLTEKTKGLMIAIFPDDLLEIAGISFGIKNKKIEQVHIPTNCLDIALQFILNICLYQELTLEEILTLLKQSYCYQNFTQEDLVDILKYLTAEEREEKTRFFFSRLIKTDQNRYKTILGKKKLELLLNFGTIVKECDFIIKDKTDISKIYGTVDTDFCSDFKVGDNFIIAGKAVKFEFKKGNSIFVTRLNHFDVTAPSWKSDMLPTSFEVSILSSNLIQFFLDCFEKNFSKKKLLKDILDFSLDSLSFNELYEFLYKQYLWQELNNISINFNKDLLIEFITLEKENLVVVFSNFGRKVNRLFCIFLSEQLFKFTNLSFKVLNSDRGIAFSFDEKHLPKIKSFFENTENLLNFNMTEIMEVFEKEAKLSTIFQRFFRRNAYRTLSILKNKSSIQTKSISEFILINSLKNTNLIIKETIRELLFDYFDYERFLEVLNLLKKDNIKIVMNSIIPSPLSFGVLRRLENFSSKISPDFLTQISYKLEFLSNKFFLKQNLGEYILFLFPQGGIIQVNNKKYLIITDLHLGIEFSLLNKYRFPELNDRNIFQVLNVIFQNHNIEKTILLGDIKESITFIHPNEKQSIQNLFNFLLENCKQIIITKGNHDGNLENIFNLELKEQLIENKLISEEPILITKFYFLEDILFHHGHLKINHLLDRFNFVFSGHLHPKVSLTDQAGVKLEFNCSLNQLIDGKYYWSLPSISPYKGGLSLEKIVNNETGTFWLYNHNNQEWFQGDINNYLQQK